MDQDKYIISYGFDTSELFVGEDQQHYDVETSIREYIILCEKYLRQQYSTPNYAIQINKDTNLGIQINGQSNRPEIVTIQAILEQVRQEWRPVKSIIQIGFYVDELFIGDNQQHYDVDTSVQKYIDLCSVALQAHYPDSKYCIEILTNSPSGIRINGQSDDFRVPAIQAILEQVRQDWVPVERPRRTLEEAYRQFNIPVPFLRWACEAKVIDGAEKSEGQWEFPLDRLTDVRKNTALGQCQKILNLSPTGAFVCPATDFLDTSLQSIVAEDTTLMIIPCECDNSLFTPDDSYVRISIVNGQVKLTFEHFVLKLPGTYKQWSYDYFARRLVKQANQAGIVSDWQGSLYRNTLTAESIQFEYIPDSTLSVPLREVIVQALNRLEIIIQETEIIITGGPEWKPEYETDEDAFCREILEPLLRRMGYRDVRYTGGVKGNEQGRDFVFSEMTRFEDFLYYAVIVKPGNIGGGYASKIDEIISQLDDAITLRYDEPGSVSVHISIFIVAISGRFTERAEDKMREKMPKKGIPVGSVYFWDKAKILSLIQRYWGSEKDTN